MKVRRLIIAVHRDFGYFFAGLTVMYAISGVAVLPVPIAQTGS